MGIVGGETWKGIIGEGRLLGWVGEAEHGGGVLGDAPAHLFGGLVQGVGDECEHLVDVFGGVVGFGEQAVGRGGLQGQGVEVASVAQVAAGGKQCAGHAFIASETVHHQGTGVGRRVAPHLEQLLPGAYAVGHYRQPEFAGQPHMAGEAPLLHGERVAAQGVESGLAHGHHLRMQGGGGQQAVVGFGECGLGSPGMEPHGVTPPRLGPELARLDGDEGVGGLQPVGMDIGDGGHGTGS